MTIAAMMMLDTKQQVGYTTKNTAWRVLTLLFIIVPLHAQLRILQPTKLASEFPPSGQIKGSTAAFGTPYWGEQLIGKLEFNVSKGNAYCSPDDYELPLHHDKAEPVNEASADDDEAARHWHRIVVVRRGKCHFAQKVKVAQDSKGASAVVIVDEAGAARGPTDIRAVIMADDGLGSKIRIPSLLISDSEGSKIIDSLQSGQNVIVELLWDLPNESVVNVDQWLSPGLSASLQYMKQFAPFAKLFKHRINFRPHFFLFSLPADAGSMCLDSSARFCSMTPDWPNSKATGAQVIEEIQREHCLWFTTKTLNPKLTDSGEYSEVWWDYLSVVAERCLRPAPRYSYPPFSKECSFEIMKELGVAVNTVQSCIDTLGTVHLTTHLYNHAWSPTAMMINDARFAGPLDAFIASRAICTGFTLSNEPEECTDLKALPIQAAALTDWASWFFGDASSHGGVSWWIYIITLFSVLATVLGVVMLYRLWLVKQLRSELRYEVFEEVKSQLGTTTTTTAKLEDLRTPQEISS